jgi:hypothetical protein
MSEVTDSKTLRERSKQIAEQRRAERRHRKRTCVLCGIEESEKTVFVAHPDGIGPSCRELEYCANYAAVANKVNR